MSLLASLPLCVLLALAGPACGHADDEGTSFAAVADTVVRPPDPSAPLADRWAWALEEVDRLDPGRGVWIGWEIRRASASLVMSSTGGETAPGGGTKTTLGRLLGELETRNRIGLVFGLPTGSRGPGGIVATRIRSFAAPIDLGGRTLVWLGPAAEPESVARLNEVFAAIPGTGPRSEWGPMLALHEDGSAAIPALRRLVFDAREPVGVRAEAAAWIGWQRDDPAAERLLRELLASGPPWEIVDEAIGALDGSSPGDRAIAARLLFDHPEPGVRSEAAQWLGEASDGEDVVEALERAAFEDPSDGVRREALDSLEEMRRGEP